MTKFDTDEKELMEIISGIPVEQMPQERPAIATIIMCVMLAGYVVDQIEYA